MKKLVHQSLSNYDQTCCNIEIKFGMQNAYLNESSLYHQISLFEHTPSSYPTHTGGGAILYAIVKNTQ